jgi:uncharacterized glyoxalase superfamily protein PhnB
MAQKSSATVPNVFPFLRYKDAPAAIEWLGRAFGFEKQMVVPGEEPGTIAHAQLNLGPGIIMLGSLRDDELGMKSPRDLGAVNQGIYIALDEVDAHYARAKAAGAVIVREPTDEDYGGRDYAARDLEGHLWSFGTYRPEPVK